MEYQQKKSIVTLVQTLAVLAAYGLYSFGKVRQGIAGWDDTQFFAVTMLKFIGVGILLAIVVQIIFHVLLSVSIAVKERRKESREIESAISAAMVEDERDKMIELKLTRISVSAFMVGFIGGLVLLALAYPVSAMLNLLFFAGGLGAAGEEAAKLICYGAGSRNA